MSDRKEHLVKSQTQTKSQKFDRRPRRTSYPIKQTKA